MRSVGVLRASPAAVLRFGSAQGARPGTRPGSGGTLTRESRRGDGRRRSGSRASPCLPSRMAISSRRSDRRRFARARQAGRGLRISQRRPARRPTMSTTQGGRGSQDHPANLAPRFGEERRRALASPSETAFRGPLTSDAVGLPGRGQTRLIPAGLRSERHATKRRLEVAAPRVDSRLDRSAVIGASVNLEGHTAQITKAALQRMHHPLSPLLALTRAQLSKREVIRVQLRLWLDQPMHRAQDQPRPARRLRVRATPSPQPRAIQVLGRRTMIELGLLHNPRGPPSPHTSMRSPASPASAECWAATRSSRPQHREPPVGPRR
jgi:hypothetical protein